jgi:hypothetical protein
LIKNLPESILISSKDQIHYANEAFYRMVFTDELNLSQLEKKDELKYIQDNVFAFLL